MNSNAIILNMQAARPAQTKRAKEAPSAKPEQEGFAEQLRKYTDQAQEPSKPKHAQQTSSETESEAAQGSADEPVDPAQQTEIQAQMLALLAAMNPLPAPESVPEPAVQPQAAVSSVTAVSQPVPELLVQGAPVTDIAHADTQSADVPLQPLRPQQTEVQTPEGPARAAQPTVPLQQPQPAPQAQTSQSDTGQQTDTPRQAHPAVEQKQEQAAAQIAQPTRPKQEQPVQAPAQLLAFAQKLQDAGITVKAAPAQPLSPPVQAQQIATAVLEAYSDGSTEFTMQLEPEALGKVTVKLVMEEGGLSLNILTANDQTAKLLNAQMAELKTSLKESGVRFDACTVENQSFQNLTSDGGFLMQNGRQQRPEYTKRLVFGRIPTSAEDGVVQRQTLAATSMLNRYA